MVNAMSKCLSLLLRFAAVSFALISGGNAISLDNNHDSSAKIPENSHLVNFLITRQGMAMEPYYMVTTTDKGIFFKISDRDPRFLDDFVIRETPEIPRESVPNAYGDRVLDCEKASLVKIEELKVLEKLEQIIEENGAVKWNGFSKRRAMRGVSDAGTSYRLFMEFSDGSTVKVDGYNSRPAGFENMLKQVADLFSEHKDYSRYEMVNFNDAECLFLNFSVTGDFLGKTSFRLELISGNFPRWLVEIKDPEGKYFEKNSEFVNFKRDISPAALPFKRFLDIMSRYHAERWNGYSVNDSKNSNSGYISIHIYFSDRREYSVKGSIPPDGFDEFLESFVSEMKAFHDEIAAEDVKESSSGASK